MAKASVTRKISYVHVPKDGEPGKDGSSVFITRQAIMYASSSSGTVPPPDGWNTVIPAVSPGRYLWTRTAVEYSDGETTVSYSVSRNASDGMPGKTYQPMRLRDWDGIVAGETLYEGSGDNDPWTDMVFTSSPEAYYRVMQTFTVPASKGNPSDSAYNGKLQAVSQFKAIATDLFLAKEGFIKNLVVNKLVTSALSGERIIIDPEQKDMRIFNSDGDLVATYGAKSRTVAEVIPPDTVSGANSASSSAAVMSFATITDDRVINNGMIMEHTKSGTVSKDLSHTAVSGSGMLKVSVPSYSVSYYPVNNVVPYMTTVSCRLSAHLIVNGTVVETRQIYSGSTPTSKVETTPAVTFGAALKAGDAYKVRIDLYYELGGGNETGSTLKVTAKGDLTAKYVADFYRSEYFGNGFAFSTNSKNYFYALFENNELKIKAVSDGTTVFSS